MNMFSKLMSLGLVISLLGAGSVSARCNDDHKRDCHQKKCDIVGAYTAIMLLGNISFDSAVFSFNADGTMIISDILGSASPATQDHTIYTGTWKSVGHNCFAYCASSVVVRNTDNFEVFRTKVSGTICFDNKCEKATGLQNFIITYFAFNDLELKTPLTSPEPFDAGALTLQRLNCCK